MLWLCFEMGLSNQKDRGVLTATGFLGFLHSGFELIVSIGALQPLFDHEVGEVGGS